MDASNSSNANSWSSQYCEDNGSSQHWEDSIDQLPNSDASDTDDDDECNFQGILELENILMHMAMILEECYYHLRHPCVRVAIP
jgi:hypothetical protein